jgi:hypothetical protein
LTLSDAVGYAVVTKEAAGGICGNNNVDVPPTRRVFRRSAFLNRVLAVAASGGLRDRFTDGFPTLLLQGYLLEPGRGSTSWPQDGHPSTFPTKPNSNGSTICLLERDVDGGAAVAGVAARVWSVNPLFTNVRLQSGSRVAAPRPSPLRGHTGRTMWTTTGRSTLPTAGTRPGQQGASVARCPRSPGGRGHGHAAGRDRQWIYDATNGRCPPSGPLCRRTGAALKGR